MQSTDNFYRYIRTNFGVDRIDQTVTLEQVVETDSYYVVLCSYAIENGDIVWDVLMYSKNPAKFVGIMKNAHCYRKALVKFCEVCLNLVK